MLNDPRTYKQKMAVLEKSVEGKETGEQEEIVTRAAIKLSGITNKQAEEIFANLGQYYFQEKEIDRNRWTRDEYTRELALKIARYFKIESAAERISLLEAIRDESKMVATDFFEGINFRRPNLTDFKHSYNDYRDKMRELEEIAGQSVFTPALQDIIKQICHHDDGDGETVEDLFYCLVSDLEETRFGDSVSDEINKLFEFIRIFAEIAKTANVNFNVDYSKLILAVLNVLHFEIQPAPSKEEKAAPTVLTEKDADVLRNIEKMAGKAFFFSSETATNVYDDLLGRFGDNDSFLKQTYKFNLFIAFDALERIKGSPRHFSSLVLKRTFGGYFKKFGNDYTSIKTSCDWFDELERLTESKRIFFEEDLKEKFSGILIEFIGGEYELDSTKHFFKDIENAVGAKPVFDEGKIYRHCYDTLTRGLLRKKDVEFVKEITGFELSFSRNEAKDAYLGYIKKQLSQGFIYKKNNFFSELDRIQECTGFALVDVLDDSAIVQEVYNNFLAGIYYFEERCAVWKKYTLIEPQFDQIGIDLAFTKQAESVRESVFIDILILKKFTHMVPSFQAATSMYHSFNNNGELKNNFVKCIDTMFELTGAYPDAEQLTDLGKLGGHFITHDKISFERLIELPSVRDRQEQLVEDCVSQVVDYAQTQPRCFIQAIHGQIKNLADFSPIAAAILTDLKKHPWIAALLKIEKIQGISENAANDPWATELEPLLKKAFKEKIISIQSSADAELIVEYVRDIGMINDTKLLNIFLDCCRARRFEDLLAETVVALESCGLSLKRKNGEWRLPGPKSAINELKTAIHHIMDDLFQDKLNALIEIEFGGRIFNILKGSTEWERGDNISDIVRKWRKTIESNPSLGKLPSGVLPKQFRVALRADERALDVLQEKTQQAELEKLFGNKEIMLSYFNFVDAITFGMRNMDIGDWWKKNKKHILNELNNSREELEQLLKTSPEEFDAVIAAETDEVKKNILVQKKKGVGSERGRIGFEKNFENLQLTEQMIWALDVLEKEKGEEIITRALEVLAQIGVKSKSVSRAFYELSALHMCSVLPAGFVSQFYDKFKDENEKIDTLPNPERIAFLMELQRQFTLEHYLHPEQKMEHTGHSPFSANLLKELKFAHGLRIDNKGRLPVEVLNGRVQTILGQELNFSAKGMLIDMIPVKGILRIYAGDFGNACYTSQHWNMAKGNFPRMFAWIYVKDYQKPSVSIRGSLLGICARRDDGVSTIVARANNPKENFIRSVDYEQFVKNSLEAVVDTARGIRNAQLKENSNLSAVEKKFCIVVPMDNSSQSSTNRPLVSQVYHKMFKGLPRVWLENTPETNFNTYPVWRADDSCGCAVIWEIDENGNEKWFGKWLE